MGDEEKWLLNVSKGIFLLTYVFMQKYAFIFRNSSASLRFSLI